MVSWLLNEFKVERSNKNILNFETIIEMPQIYTAFKVIYDGQKLIVNGSETELGYSIYEIERRLESLLEASLIKELSKYSNNEEYLRAFVLTSIGNQPDGIIADLNYVYNDKYLTLGPVLVITPRGAPEDLCRIPLEVKTNAVSSIKSYHELLTEICRSAIRINIDLNNVKEILNILVQKIGDQGNSAWKIDVF
jgi:hypothetical protein